ncbi:MAG: matrixin family metalloprotease [Polyangiales bacterium]|nr:matrixin family metalloprotease [Myxococcales bacterium]MCB9657618.1 matrixin family metalloprotease [Sandaracinaceae bacterium]
MTTSSMAPTLAMPCVTDGVPLSWRNGCMAYAVDYRGGIDLSAAQIEGVLDASFRTWMDVTCDGGSPGFDVRGYSERATCQDAQFRSSRGNVNVVAMVTDWEERDYDPDAFAISTVWHNTDTGSILDVDILVNEQLGPYALCPATGCPPALPRDQVVDFQNVITHEVGHFFGIAHSDVPNATMYVSAARGETLKRTLADDDIEAMCTIYAPGTLNACTDHTPRGGLDLNCEDDARGSSCSVGRPDSPVGAWGVLVLAVLTLCRGRKRQRRVIRRR